MHATEPIKLTTISTQNLHIIDAIKYSNEENNTTTWTIPIVKERIVNLSTITVEYCNTEDYHIYIKHISNIVKVIEYYKVVYFKNLPFNYPKIFKDVSEYWSARRKHKSNE